MQKAAAKDLAKQITEPVMSALRPITEGMQKAVELAKYSSIQAAKTDQDIDTSMVILGTCLLYTSPSPRDRTRSRMPSSA